MLYCRLLALPQVWLTNSYTSVPIGAGTATVIVPVSVCPRTNTSSTLPVEFSRMKFMTAVSDPRPHVGEQLVD